MKELNQKQLRFDPDQVPMSKHRIWAQRHSLTFAACSCCTFAHLATPVAYKANKKMLSQKQAFDEHFSFALTVA